MQTIKAITSSEERMVEGVTLLLAVLTSHPHTTLERHMNPSPAKEIKDYIIRCAWKTFRICNSFGKVQLVHYTILYYIVWALKPNETS